MDKHGLGKKVSVVLLLHFMFLLCSPIITFGSTENFKIPNFTNMKINFKNLFKTNYSYSDLTKGLKASLGKLSSLGKSSAPSSSSASLKKDLADSLGLFNVNPLSFSINSPSLNSVGIGMGLQNLIKPGNKNIKSEGVNTLSEISVPKYYGLATNNAKLNNNSKVMQFVKKKQKNLTTKD
jgi:hypothetical protein